MNRQEHWNRIYQSKGPQGVSWYQRRPDLSLALITESGVGKDAGIIDIGGGASPLVDFLLDAGYSRLAVLDWSGVALALSRERLGARAQAVRWFEKRMYAPLGRHIASAYGTIAPCFIF